MSLELTIYVCCSLTACHFYLNSKRLLMLWQISTWCKGTTAGRQVRPCHQKDAENRSFCFVSPALQHGEQKGGRITGLYTEVIL